MVVLLQSTPISSGSATQWHYSDQNQKKITKMAITFDLFVRDLYRHALYHIVLGSSRTKLISMISFLPWIIFCHIVFLFKFFCKTYFCELVLGCTLSQNSAERFYGVPFSIIIEKCLTFDLTSQWHVKMFELGVATFI